MLRIKKLYSGLHSFGKGVLPRALQVDRPFNMTKLKSGITVVSEAWPSQTSTINVIIKCGSRNQTPQTSGTAHFLEHLHFKGTSKRSRITLEKQVEQIGGRLDAFTSRELTCYTINVFDHLLPRGLQIVSDMLCRSLYKIDDIQAERNTILTELMQTKLMNPLELLLEMSHKYIYAGHQIGLPILGEVQNINTISRQMIVDYHQQNYSKQNIFIIGTGNVKHSELEQAVQQCFKGMRDKVVPSKSNQDAIRTPEFQSGSMLFPENIDDVRVSVVHNAPSFFNDDFYSVLILQRLIGDRPETLIQQQIIKGSQDFKFQHILAQNKWISQQKGFYTAYKDAGVYGNYFKVQPEKIVNLPQIISDGYSKFSQQITQLELQRAKRKVYMEILNHESQNQIAQSIANYILYYNRRVSRREIGERVAAVGTREIKEAIGKYVLNRPMGLYIWSSQDKVKHVLDIKGN